MVNTYKNKLDSSGFTRITADVQTQLDKHIRGMKLREGFDVFYNTLYNFCTTIDMQNHKEVFTTPLSDFVYTLLLTNIIEIEPGSIAERIAAGDINDMTQVNKILSKFVAEFVPLIETKQHVKGTDLIEIKQYLKLQGDDEEAVEELFSLKQADYTPDIEDSDQEYLDKGYVDFTTLFNKVLRSEGFFINRGLYDVYYHKEEDNFLIHVLAGGDTKVEKVTDLIDALLLLEQVKGLYTNRDEQEDDIAILGIKLRKALRELNSELTTN